MGNFLFKDIITTENNNIIICGHWEFFIMYIPEIGECTKRISQNKLEKFESKDPRNIYLFGWNGFEKNSYSSYQSAILLLKSIDEMTDGKDMQISVLMPGEGVNHCLREDDNLLLIAGLLLQHPKVDLYLNSRYNTKENVEKLKFFQKRGNNLKF